MSRIELIPVLSGLVRELDQNIGRFGLQVGTRRFLEQKGAAIQVSNLNPTVYEILQNRPAILISNHPFSLEPLILCAASPSRKDFFMTGNTFFKGICKNLDEHLVPLFIRHKFFDRQQRVLSKVMNFLHPYEVFDAFQEARLNIESLRLAARKIGEGGLVVIFPGASAIPGNEQWQSGVGLILRQLRLRRENDVSLIMAYIKGTSTRDYLRLIPWMQSFFPPFCVTFSEPRNIADIELTDKSSLIARDLEIQYKNWVLSLTCNADTKAHELKR